MPESASSSTDPEATGGPRAKTQAELRQHRQRVHGRGGTVVAGRRRAGGCSVACSPALSGLSSLTVERKARRAVRKELDLGRRLRQVQTQLEGLEEGERHARGRGGGGGGRRRLGEVASRRRVSPRFALPAKNVLGWKEEPKKKDGEAREKGETARATSAAVDLTEPPAKPWTTRGGGGGGEDGQAEELVPDEFGPDVLPPRTTGPGDDGEVLATVSDVIPEEDPADGEDSNEKPGWFTASYDAYLSDRVRARERDARRRESGPNAADGVIGDKLKVLDADGDGASPSTSSPPPGASSRTSSTRRTRRSFAAWSRSCRRMSLAASAWRTERC